MTEQQRPEGLETKDTSGEHVRIAGAVGDERLIGYSPAAVPNKDGMADGFTPGVTNTPGPYEAPSEGATQQEESASGKSAGDEPGGEQPVTAES